jgi:hypothetical protein
VWYLGNGLSKFLSFRFRRGFTLQDALNILEANDEDGLDVEGIFIAPPESAVLTDEDSGDEESGGLVDNLSGKQLLAAAEIRFNRNNDRVVDENEKNGFGEDNNEAKDIENENIQSTAKEGNIDGEEIGNSEDQPTAQEGRVDETDCLHVENNNLTESFILRKTAVFQEIKVEYMHELKQKKEFAKKKKKNKNLEPPRKSWVEGDIEDRNAAFPVADFSKYKDFSASELFELFFDDEIFYLIEEETRRYALFKNCPDPNITINNIKCFLGILLYTGYKVLPGKRFYWDSQPDLQQGFVSNAMRRNKFESIMKFLHLADNTNPNLQDKMWKLRPLIDKIQKKNLEHFVPVQDLNYDESMIEYFGRHGCKQCIRGKPIRFGYKVWCVNSPNGYLINFEIYQGKSLAVPTDYQFTFGKSAAPLVHLLDSFPAEKSELPYRIYIDNLFTNFRLLKYLCGIGYSGIGTIREDRIPQCCPLKKKKEMKDTERGSYEYALCKDDGILVCSWHDNGVVSIASNAYGVQPVTKVKRYSQAQKKHIQVDRPAVFGKYNESMGGTDRMDQNVANYRISIRSKKWYWPILTWLIDTCVHNAWQLRRSAGNLQPQLDFRRELVITYIVRFGEASKGPGRPITSKRSVSDSRVSDDIRYDGMDHLVVSTPQKKRRRCAGEGCVSVGRTMCRKCDVGLCIECFSIFHSVTY